MGNLAQLDLQTKGGEARVRSLLEDLVSYYKGAYPGRQLALVVWFGKSANSAKHNLLALFTGLYDGIASQEHPLAWKTGSNDPPFANISATSVDYFSNQLGTNPQLLEPYFRESEVIFFDKGLLPHTILDKFNVLTEPPGLLRGWYIAAREYSKTATVQSLLGPRSSFKAQIGLVKTEESTDFNHCRGLPQIEVEQRWLPISPAGLQSFMFYLDWQDGRSGYFLFEGGALYHILKFEVKTAPEYSSRVLEKRRDDRYVEVYLQAVYPPELATT